jgi:hypothetical protein
MLDSTQSPRKNVVTSGRTGSRGVLHNPLAAKDSLRVLLVSTAFIVSVTGCGSSGGGTASSPPIAAKPDVIVTLDGEHHGCVVALYTEAHGSAISCGDVVPFVKDELRLPRGAIYDIRTIPDVDQAEISRVGAALDDAGYRFIGGPHVMFLTGPHKGQ